MRLAARLLAALAFVCIGADFASAYTLKSFEGRFSVEFPSAPKLEHILDVGTCRTDRYEYKLAERGRVWFASYQDCLPRGFLADVGHGPFLRDFYKGVVKAVKGSLRANDPIDHGVLTGREILVAIPHGNQVLRMQIFIEGDRLYKVMYVGPFRTQADPEVEAFFASFRVMR
jgi:hypothetical protein